MSSVVTVVLVDDDPACLDFLFSWLSDACLLPYTFQILHQAKRGDEALCYIKASQPDLVILDLDLPDISGMDVARLIQHQPKQPHIMLFSAHDDLLNWQDPATACIQGYVLKGSTLEKMEAALETILKGGLYWDPVIYYQMHQKLNQAHPHSSVVWSSPLTERESEIFQLFCQGFKQAEIMASLKLSLNTVKSHLRNVCLKAGCENLEHLRNTVFSTKVG
ncbi:MAG: response regulator [Candidatus Sericytochromatia bacterium]